MTPLLRFLGGISIFAGVFFSFAAVVAILRFPDVYTRLHGGTKALSGGAILILLGAMPYAGGVAGALKLFLIAVFFLVSNPMASHAIARACHRRTLANRPIDEKKRDDV
ncbi:MAG TPA: monovalent cation/H(+) antiporter subunit G [Aminobacteriaceae bacterium]|nr:monovalent cation/H(+) antiporter subunit G [Aminobacteriaceae bacterium]